MIRKMTKVLKTGILIGTAILTAKKLQRTTQKIRTTWAEDTNAKDPKIRYRN